jgi:LysR family transcriptional regulator, glycine cleavage system transcriptional activator
MPLMGEDLCAVAAPASLAGLPSGPDALAGLPFLHDGSEEGWRIWRAALGRPDLMPPQGIVFNDYNLVVEAAMAGLGVMIGRTALIAEALRSGRLVAVNPLRVRSPRAYHLIRPRRPALPAAQLVWDWLLHQGRSS